MFAQHSLARLLGMAAVLALAAGGARAGVVSAWDGTTPAPNDSTSWAQLGSDGTTIGTPFGATSADGVGILGTLGGSAGLVAVQCPASPSCSWTGGFPAGQSLIWTFDNTATAGSGPLMLLFSSDVLAAGLDIQADAPGPFTATAEAFDAFGAPIGAFSFSSDTAGDPVFAGIQDTAADIARIQFDLSSCSGTCDLNDFAAGTLSSLNPTTTSAPEPASLVLVATALLAFGGRRRLRR